MAFAAPSRTQLHGQALVDAFMEDFRSYLMKTPTRSIKATKQVIVETVVRESPRLQHSNTNHLPQQLPMALNARCRQHFGLRYENLGGGIFKVKVVVT